MKNYFKQYATTRLPLLSIALSLGLALPLPALAATVALASSPLATSTTTSVKPNLLLILDNSGSMDWDHMPDDVSDGGSDVPFAYGYYGIRSAQCNQVYYNPNTTYNPPVDATGTSYANASFTAACTNGFSGACSVNLQTGFTANQSNIGGNAGGTDGATTAYYYNYSGAQTTQLQKNYNSTTNTFYSECHSTQYAAPGKDVFTKIVLSNTATATTATIVAGCTSCNNTTATSIKLDGQEILSAATPTATTATTTIAGEIATQINLCTSAKVGNCTTVGGHGYTASVSGSTVTITGLAATASSLIATTTGTTPITLTRTIFPIANATKLTNFANWYSFYRTRLLMMKTAAGEAFSTLTSAYRVGLMKISASTSPSVLLNTFDTTTGNRTAWYTALYGTTTSGSTPLRTALSNAGRYYAGKLGVTDPVQYSCQQNFSILSTDGYWNAGDDVDLGGNTNLIGNQDGTAGRPMYDGAQTTDQYTFTYTRSNYSKVSSTSCTGSNKVLKTQPEIGTCVKSVSTGSCTPTNWINNGASTLGTTCNKINAPSPTTPVLQGTPVASLGSSGGSSDSLADVAMYYYQNDLRTTALNNCGGAPVAPATEGPLCINNVFINGTDNNTQQHMTTFTLGLGASGWMNYSQSYMSDITGDYVAVKQGTTADSTTVPPTCSWQANGTTCNWPLPGMNGSNGLIANIDDLWHAAVDGRGAYFSATDVASLATGLSNALTAVNSRKGSASAAATSTLNPVPGNNFAFFASYTTVAWKGNLEARGINVDTGAISHNATWCAENVVADTCAAPSTVVAEVSGSTTIYNCVTPNSVICTGGSLVGTDCKIPVAVACTGTMTASVNTTTDTRIIKTANATGTALINFDTAYRAANASYFDAAHISTLGQWSSLDTMTGTSLAVAQAAAEGDNLINFLRGQHGHEDRTANAATDRLYRYREAVLGDALESQPQFIAKPVFLYPYPGYSTFATAQANRAGTVYMGANDGMMHAFVASDRAADATVIPAITAETGGTERWAYVPSMVIPNMWKLADVNYGTNHVNFINGSGVIGDVCTANCTDPATAVWKTILVGGLNGGGRGYYALDITVPTAPVLLWEFTTTAGIGVIKDDNLGYSYGVPVITTKQDGTWVVLVTSGYNNVSPGDGNGYLFVLNAGTGAIINKISTATGTTTTPSGLAKIVTWNNETGGNQAGYTYGGDLQGNVWRFDINSCTATVACSSVLKFATLLDGSGVAQPITTTPVLGSISGKRMIYIGTGKYLEIGDLTTTQQQTQYAIQDDDVTTTLVNARSALAVQTMINNPDGTATRLINSANAVSGRGWYVDFIASGERVNIDSKLIQGTLVVPSLVPSNTACTPGGYGFLNFFDFKTGGAVDTSLLGSIKYDSPIVGINEMYLAGGVTLGVVTAGGGIQPPSNPPVATIPKGFQKKRVIWREIMP